MATLAALDLTLNYPLPSSRSSLTASPAALRPMIHSGGSCGRALILTLKSKIANKQLLREAPAIASLFHF